MPRSGARIGKPKRPAYLQAMRNRLRAQGLIGPGGRIRRLAPSLSQQEIKKPSHWQRKGNPIVKPTRQKQTITTTEMRDVYDPNAIELVPHFGYLTMGRPVMVEKRGAWVKKPVQVEKEVETTIGHKTTWNAKRLTSHRAFSKTHTHSTGRKHQKGAGPSGPHGKGRSQGKGRKSKRGQRAKKEARKKKGGTF